MDSIVLLYDKGKVIKGKITFYDNWYEDWKAGIGSGEIMSIEFDEGEAPAGLTKEDIKSVYDQADRKFKNKMGVNYEEFCRAGKPTYQEVIAAKKTDDEQNQNGVIEIMADVESVNRQIEDLKSKLESKKDKDEYTEFIKREDGKYRGNKKELIKDYNDFK